MRDDNPRDAAIWRQLLATLSHDLRNPLAAVVTNLEFAQRLLKKTPGHPDLGEAVGDSAAACEVLRRIVANLDVLARENELAVSALEHCVATLCGEVVARCEQRASQAGVALGFVDGGSKGRALLDKALFALAFENLLCNALQHAPPGSAVQVTVSEAAAQVRVVVSDEGGAVPDALRELAVSAAGNTLAGRKPGSRYGRGLSLLTARLAAEALGVELSLGGEGTSSEMALLVSRVR